LSSLCPVDPFSTAQPSIRPSIPYYLHRLRCKVAIKSEKTASKTKGKVASPFAIFLWSPRIIKGTRRDYLDLVYKRVGSGRSPLPFMIFMRLLFIFSNFRLLIFPPPTCWLNFSHRKTPANW